MSDKFTLPEGTSKFKPSPEMLEFARQLSALEKLQDRPSLILKHPSVATNKLLSEQLVFWRKEAEESKSNARIALRLAMAANIIAIIAIAIAAKDQIFEAIISWLL